eukprot:2424683-Prymnesium_polylepis.1
MILGRSWARTNKQRSKPAAEAVILVTTSLHVCVDGLRGRGTTNMARVRDARTTRAGSHAE